MRKTGELDKIWEYMQQQSRNEAQEAWKLWEQIQELSVVLWKRYDKTFGQKYEEYIERRRTMTDSDQSLQHINDKQGE
jgi:hypothetical protein